VEDISKKLRISYPIIVEGKYDRLRLLNICDAHIITTDGFGIFKKNEKLALIRQLCEKTPIIVLTDSDGAGKIIRSHITSAIPNDRIIQLYIPQIEGKEKRKSIPSAEGTLGVEGMEFSLLYKLLLPFHDKDQKNIPLNNQLSKTDLYTDGLLGSENSSEKRDKLARALGLPMGMTSNALLAALKILISYEEYLKIVERENKA